MEIINSDQIKSESRIMYSGIMPSNISNHQSIKEVTKLYSRQLFQFKLLFNVLFMMFILETIPNDPSSVSLCAGL